MRSYELKPIKDKKGNINILAPAVMTLVLAAILLVFGLLMLDELWDQTTSGTEAYSAANKTIVGIGKFSDYFDLITLGIVIAVIIGLVLMAFSMRRVK